MQLQAVTIDGTVIESDQTHVHEHGITLKRQISGSSSRQSNQHQQQSAQGKQGQQPGQSQHLNSLPLENGSRAI